MFWVYSKVVVFYYINLTIWVYINILSNFKNLSLLENFEYNFGLAYGLGISLEVSQGTIHFLFSISKDPENTHKINHNFCHSCQGFFIVGRIHTSMSPKEIKGQQMRLSQKAPLSSV